jgi:hypothetical protein
MTGTLRDLALQNDDSSTSSTININRAEQHCIHSALYLQLAHYKSSQKDQPCSVHLLLVGRGSLKEGRKKSKEKKSERTNETKRIIQKSHHE